MTNSEHVQKIAHCSDGKNCVVNPAHNFSNTPSVELTKEIARDVYEVDKNSQTKNQNFCETVIDDYNEVFSLTTGGEDSQCDTS